jgi:hypothetical protein
VQSRGVGAIIWYTLLRIAVFAGLWFLIQLLTPVRGLWAIVAALLLSGAISMIVLNRQRDSMSVVVAGFFGRINDRIEQGKRAEDDLYSQAHGEQDAVPEHEQPGGLEHGNEGGSDRAAQDASQRSDGEGQGEQREERRPPVDEREQPRSDEGN